MYVKKQRNRKCSRSRSRPTLNSRYTTPITHPIGLINVKRKLKKYRVT